jgi:molybdopterin-guanine dinucleotide biosynthesis protein A
VRIAGAVLAGGASERMARRPKALVEVDGVSLVERAARTLARVVSPVVISANDPSRFARLGIRVVPDEVRGRGPLAAIAACLAAVDADALLVVACDMPFLDASVLARLVALAPGFDLVVPRARGNLQPLCAVYARACLAPIRSRLAAGRLDLRGLAAEVRSREVDEAELADLDPALRTFEDVDTPEDVERLLGPSAAAGARALPPDTP